jgi:hypothetical protein
MKIHGPSYKKNPKKILLHRFNFVFQTIGFFYSLNAGSFWSSALHDEQAGSQSNRK